MRRDLPSQITHNLPPPIMDPDERDSITVMRVIGLGDQLHFDRQTVVPIADLPNTSTFTHKRADIFLSVILSHRTDAAPRRQPNSRTNSCSRPRIRGKRMAA